ncbi:MAG TPA: adenylate/guanylate cyclase domain-containing protein [Solirubrobacteraceae bacterium]|nr:adenylate/guanylate cyclase domain-containing protein [Solirubrobacteraceae bacterium]
MAAEDRPLQQAAGRAAGLIARFLSERDTQPLAEALSPLTQRLGLTPELEGVATETTLLFSDLDGFASWVLEAGDDRALELLRELGVRTEPLIADFRGRLVKRLGSGHMAAFRRPRDGLAAAVAMLERTTGLDMDGTGPVLRIGLHLGMPQRVGRDYLGADVNIAARLAEAAAPGEILASRQLLASVGSDTLAGLLVRHRRGFRAKGVPADLEVYAVTNPLI